jgi:hypothetical protein
MPQYKFYTLTPELKHVQKHLLKYDQESLNEAKFLAAGSSDLKQAEIASTASEFLCSHLPQEAIFALGETMGLSFATRSGTPYLLNEGMSTEGRLSSINYQPGDAPDKIQISAGVELELNRFSDTNNVSMSSYMFLKATVKTTALPYKNLGAKLKELFGFNNYYAYEDASGVIIKSDAEGARATMVKDHRFLAQLGLANRFAPTMLQQQVLDQYLSQNDTEKTITVKLAEPYNKDITVLLKKDAAGAWQAYVPEVSAVDSLEVVVPARDDNGVKVSLKQMPHGVKLTSETALTELELYAMRSSKFQAGFNLATFQGYAKQQGICELLPSWASLIASDQAKYQGVLDHYINKFDQGLLENPLYFVSFMQRHNIHFSYNDHSLPLMFSALEQQANYKPMLYGEYAKGSRDLSQIYKSQQHLLKGHRSVATAFVRSLAKLNATMLASKKQRLASTVPGVIYGSKDKIVLKSPAVIITRAANRFIARHRQKPAAEKLQAVVRSRLKKLSYRKAIKSVIIIQSTLRRVLSKRKIATIQHSIRKVQAFMRMNLAMNAYGHPKKIVRKPSAPKKFINKVMQARIAKDEAESFTIVNECLESEYRDYNTVLLKAIEDSDPENIAAAFMQLSTNIANLHIELAALVGPDTLTKLMAGKEKIVVSISAMNTNSYDLCIAKDELYVKYLADLSQDEDSANQSLIDGLESICEKYSRESKQIELGLLVESVSSLGMIFGLDTKEAGADLTTIESISKLIILTSGFVGDYLHGLPKDVKDLAVYALNIKTLVGSFEADVGKAYTSYDADLASGSTRQAALTKFNLSMKDHRISLQDELEVAIPHVQNALRAMMRGIKLEFGNKIPVMAAELIQRKIREYFKTSTHKKKMARFYSIDFKAASRLDAVIKIQAAARIFLERNRDIKRKNSVLELQPNPRSLMSLPTHAGIQAEAAEISPKLELKAMVGISSKSASSTKLSSGLNMLSSFKSGAQNLMQKIVIKLDQKPKNKEVDSRILAARLAMIEEPKPMIVVAAPIVPQPHEKAPLKPLAKAQKDFLAKADVSHLRAITKDLFTKVDTDIALLESSVVASPKDKKEIAKLRYLYVIGGDKGSLTDGVVLAKAKLALVRRMLLDPVSQSEVMHPDAAIALVRNLAATIATIPVHQMRVSKVTGDISFSGGYVWPKLLNRLANKKKGLLHVAASPIEREVWFKSICDILEQPCSLTPTIDVGGVLPSSKREEIEFIDNAVTQLLVAMSKGSIRTQNLLLQGLKTAIYQINHGGYKPRVLKGSASLDRKNMLHLLKSFNLALDAFENEVLAKNLKNPGSQHDEGFIARKDDLEQIFIDLLELFKVFDKDCNAYKNTEISREWLAVVGKVHFLAYDNHVVTDNNIGFSAKFLNHHKACIYSQNVESGVHPVRAILANAKVSHTFSFSADQLQLTAQEMLELGEVTLDENKSSCDIELATTNSDRVAVVQRPYDNYFMHTLLFICATTTVVLIGLLTTLLAASLAYAIPAIALFSFASYKISTMIDKEVTSGHFKVASPALMATSAPVSAINMGQMLGVSFTKAAANDKDQDEEIEIDLGLNVTGR